MTPLRLALLSLIRRKATSLIAVGSIAIAVASSGVLLRLFRLSHSRFSTLAQGGDAVVGAKAGGLNILLGSLNLEGPYPDFLPLNLFLTLKANVDVRFEDGASSKPTYLRSIVPMVYFAKFFEARVIGTDESFVQRPGNPLEMAQGKWCTEKGCVVAGAAVAKKYNLEPGAQVPTETWTGDDDLSSISTLRLTTSGVLKPTGTMWDRALYASLEQAREVLQRATLGSRSIWQGNVLHYFLVYLQPNGLSELRTLINQRTVGEVISIPEERARLEKLTGSGKALGLIMSLAIMALGGLCVAAMMVTRFEAMSVQLAILRALGYRRLEISLWLVWEGVVLAVLALLIGALLDALTFASVRGLLGEALPAPELVPMPLWQSSPVWILALLTTVGASAVPLIRLYRQDVHDSLKAL